MTQQYGGPPPHGYAPPPTHYARPKKKRTGLILALIAGGLLLMGGCIAALSSGGAKETPTTASAEKAAQKASGEASTAKTAKPKPEMPGIGDVVKDGKFSFKVTKVDKRAQVGNSFLNKKAQGQFLLVHVTVKNIGDEAQSFFGNNQLLHDARGREYEADAEASLYLENSKSLYEEINPGNTVRGIVLFDVPQKTKIATIELHDSAFSDGVKVSLT